MNKYNLQVGDKIKIFSLWEIKEISKKEGVIFKGKSYYFPWKYVNRALDDGNWFIEERASFTEYKVGDKVDVTPAMMNYYIEGGEFCESGNFIGEYISQPIKEIKGEYAQLECHYSAWFKLSGLPPKTKYDMIKMYYEIGDIVVWKPTGKVGTIASELMTDGLNKDCYNLDINGDLTSHNSCHYTNLRKATLEEVKQYIMKEKKIIGYKFKEEYKHLEAAACKIAFADSAYANETTFAAVPGWNDKNTNFGASSGSYVKLKAAGVLDLWFEPVYKSQETILKLGDKKIDVTIGKGYIKADGKNISREDVSKLLGYMEGNLLVDYPWTIEFPTVKIGCTIFKQGELDVILGSYDELNT